MIRRTFSLCRRLHPLDGLEGGRRGLGVSQVHFLGIETLFGMRLGKVGFEASVGVEAPLATVAPKFDIGNFRSVIFVIRMELLKVPFGIKLKTKYGWT